MTNKSKHLVGIVCVAFCALCAGFSAWSLFHQKTVDVHVTPTNLLSSEMPIRYVNGSPLVDCLINGKPAVMEIDTGSTSVLIKESALAKFHIDADARSHSIRVPGGVSAEARSLSAFTIAFPSVGISAEIHGANCTAFEHVSHDGLLGIDLLRAIGARIDLKRGVLEFQCKEKADDK